MAGLRVGVVSELTDVEGIQPEVRAAVDAARNLFEKAGAEVDTVSVPSVEYGLSAYYIIAPAEASSNLARYDGVRYGLRGRRRRNVATMNALTREAGFGAEVKRRIMLGTYALSAGYYDAYYGQAQRVRTLIIRDFARAYERFDVLLAPTSPTTAFELGRQDRRPAGHVPVRRVHDPHQPDRRHRHLGAGRPRRRRPADRRAGAGAGARGGRPAPGRPRRWRRGSPSPPARRWEVASGHDR